MYIGFCDVIKHIQQHQASLN